ncbi:MAG: hypothetical protein WA702_05050 [Bradyrhizobium sp.]
MATVNVTSRDNSLTLSDSVSDVLTIGSRPLANVNAPGVAHAVGLGATDCLEGDADGALVRGEGAATPGFAVGAPLAVFLGGPPAALAFLAASLLVFVLVLVFAVVLALVLAAFRACLAFAPVRLADDLACPRLAISLPP